MSGLFAGDGSLNITVVTDNSHEGQYAPDGSLYVKQHSTEVGVYSASGAMVVTKRTVAVPAIVAQDGSINVSVSPYVSGTMRVTVVGGVLV
jgi:hypothetical protein